MNSRNEGSQLNRNNDKAPPRIVGVNESYIERIFKNYRLYKFILETIDDDSLMDFEEQEKWTFINRYCNFIEQNVSTLPDLEKQLIQKRYMSANSEYVTNEEVYTKLLNPSVSWTKFSIIRKRAFFKLARTLPKEM